MEGAARLKPDPLDHRLLDFLPGVNAPTAIQQIPEDKKSDFRSDFILQQILGNCSPESMFTTRVLPIRVFISTIPASLFMISPIATASLPRG